jgi:hypothetical protein
MMDAWRDVTTQLRLLGDLRDVLEKYLALSHRTSAVEQASEEYVKRITELLLDIQRRRTELLVQQTGVVGEVIGAELEGGQAILSNALDMLKNIASLYPPLYSPFRDVMASVESYIAPRRDA